MAKAVVVHNTPVVPEERCAVEHVLMARFSGARHCIGPEESETRSLMLRAIVA